MFKILDVPNVKQLENYCGPAALSMVARYYSHEISQEEIAEYWGGKKHFEMKHGVNFHSMVQCAKDLGFKTHPEIEMNLEDIIFYIDKRIPIIAMITSPAGNCLHYCVIRGYKTHPEMVFVNNPFGDLNDSKNNYGKCMLYERFNQKWAINKAKIPNNYGLIVENNIHTYPEELVKRFKK